MHFEHKVITNALGVHASPDRNLAVWEQLSHSPPVQFNVGSEVCYQSIGITFERSQHLIWNRIEEGCEIVLNQNLGNVICSSTH